MMRRMGLATLTTMLALTTALVAAGAPAMATEDRAFVLTKGHIDAFELTWNEAAGGLDLQVKDDSGLYGEGTQYHEPEDVTIQLDENLAKLEVPEGLPDDYAFLGPAGTVVWDLPQDQNPELPWPGWSTERLTGTIPAGSELADGNSVSFSVSVEGPGDVHTFMVGPFGEVINHYVDTTDGGPDIIPATSHTHAHTEWIFTELGDYFLTVTPSAVTATGATLTGPAASYHFQVGAPAVDPVPATTSTSVALSAPSQSYGATLPARATVTVAAGAVAGVGTAQLKVDGAAVGAPVSLSGGTATVALPRTLLPGAHQVTAAFTPADPAAQTGSSSAASRLAVVRARSVVAARLRPLRVRATTRGSVVVRVGVPGTTGVVARGRVVVKVGRRQLAARTLTGGRVVVRLPRLRPGRHRVVVRYLGNGYVQPSSSQARVLRVVR